jgi:hypothetical protein
MDMGTSTSVYAHRPTHILNPHVSDQQWLYQDFPLSLSSTASSESAPTTEFVETLMGSSSASLEYDLPAYDAEAAPATLTDVPVDEIVLLLQQQDQSVLRYFSSRVCFAVMLLW